MDKRFEKQLKEYKRAGFTVKSVESGRGSHLRVVFNEFSAPQFLTTHTDDWRAIKNNIARFRRLQREGK